MTNPMFSKDVLETRLRNAAAELEYPATPNLVASWRAVQTKGSRPGKFSLRPAAWAVVLILVVGLLALSVPTVRAAVVEFIQLGVIRVFIGEPTVTPSLEKTPTVEGADPPSGAGPFLTSVLQLAGETSFADAEARAGFDIPLPTYPETLGPPDHVYFPKMDGAFVVVVWVDVEDPDFAELSLHILGPDAFAGKSAPEVVENTKVNGVDALWIEGEHLFGILDPGREDFAIFQFGRLVDGHVLVWTDGALTLRLETSLPLAEAVRIAESIKK